MPVLKNYLINSHGIGIWPREQGKQIVAAASSSQFGTEGTGLLARGVPHCRPLFRRTGRIPVFPDGMEKTKAITNDRR
jgi:hypothetical protein